MSSSLKNTQKIAKEVAKKFLNKKITLFNGEMGSGKTTFILSLLNALKVKETAGSPTFTLVNEYHSGGKTILHFDLYRIEDEKELINIDFREQIENADLAFIEWPDIAKKYLNLSDCQTINIKKIDEKTREFVIED